MPGPRPLPPVYLLSRCPFLSSASSFLLASAPIPFLTAAAAAAQLCVGAVPVPLVPARCA